jgi:hypothetical protein
MIGGSGFQPRFIWAIAVKNRSHNPNTIEIKSQSFLFDQTGRFFLASGPRSYETFFQLCVSFSIRLAVFSDIGGTHFKVL